MRNFPTTILNISDYCAMGCSHCYLGRSHKMGGGEIGLDDAHLIFENLTRFGITKIGLEGDHSNILGLVRTAYDLGLAVSIAPSIVEFDVAKLTPFSSRLLSVHFSLDGSNPYTHDKLRKNKGHFERTLRHIRLVKDIGLKVFLFTAVSLFNLDEAEDIVELANSLDVDSIAFLFLSPFGQGDGLKDIVVPCEDWESFCLRLDKIRQRISSGLRIIYEPSCVGRKKFNQYIQSGYRGCSLYSRHMLAVDHLGNAFFCPLLMHPRYRHFTLGNLLSESLEYLWSDSQLWKKYQALADKYLSIRCKGCDVLSYCRGGCFARSLSDPNHGHKTECSINTYIPMCLMYWDWGNRS